MRLPVLCYLIGALSLKSVPSSSPPPSVDHHQHLLSPAIAKSSPPLAAGDLVRLLDQAGIRRAVVLSQAYSFGNPNRPAVENEYEAVKAENDWTSQEVARFPDRLRGFCGVNPLKDYAPAEIERCAGDPQLHFGVKLHFGNSDVDLDNPQHIERLRRVFRVANDHGMAIVAHIRSSVTRQRPYGAKQARALLTDVLPAAPDVPVQIAHLTGSGGYDDRSVDEALGVFVDAIANHDSRMARVYFDVSGLAGFGHWGDKVDLIASRIRQIGIGRILYGSDGAIGGGLPPREAWAAFLKLPLSDAEFRTIAANVAPYMR